jgi:hypothetical protein
MGSAGGDRSRCARAIYLAKGMFLCPNWNMKELERRILKKVEEKGWRDDDDDRREVSMLQGIREVTT